MNLMNCIRRVLWRILGIDYNHILRTIDYVYLKEDKFSELDYKSYANNALVFRWSDAPIRIGKYCSIADGVRLIVDDGKHKTNCVTSYPFQENLIGKKRGITIGNDVWIGQNVVILPGIKIGNGVTIGAGSVVTKDIPDYCVAGGVPARIIKRKCSVSDAELMNRIAWWNWSNEKILENTLSLTGSIEEFIKKFK